MISHKTGELPNNAFIAYSTLVCGASQAFHACYFPDSQYSVMHTQVAEYCLFCWLDDNSPEAGIWSSARIVFWNSLMNLTETLAVDMHVTASFVQSGRVISLPRFGKVRENQRQLCALAFYLAVICRTNLASILMMPSLISYWSLHLEIQMLKKPHRNFKFLLPLSVHSKHQVSLLQLFSPHRRKTYNTYTVQNSMA